jgi:hypothetical protein
MSVATGGRIGRTDTVLRIVELADGNGVPSIRIEGKVVGLWVDELRQSADRILAGSGALIVDLSDLTFADTAGIALLRELAGRGVTMVNCSAFADAHLGDTGCRDGME